MTTPEALQEYFGIDKSAYYDAVKFLKGQGYEIKTHRDAKKRTIIEPESVQLLSALPVHVVSTGSREGFQYRGELALSNEAGNLEETRVSDPEPSATDEDQLDDVVRQAQQLVARNLVMGNLVVLEMARQMSYDDLPDDLKQQVDQLRAAAVPKGNPVEVASSLLSQ